MNTHRPLLLLIPGMLNTDALWQGVASQLEDQAEIRIAQVRTQASIADMAADAWRLIADADPAQRVVICGFSMGGYVAAEMLATPARPVAALVLIGTSAQPDTAESRENREKTAAAMSRDYTKVVNGVAAFGTSANHPEQARHMAELVRMALEVGQEGGIRQTRAIAARSDRRDVLNALSIPVWIACGRDDRITPPALSEELAALIPRAELRWIDTAGHMAPLEQPSSVADVISQALRSAAATDFTNP